MFEIRKEKKMWNTMCLINRTNGNVKLEYIKRNESKRCTANITRSDNNWLQVEDSKSLYTYRNAEKNQFYCFSMGSAVFGLNTLTKFQNHFL